MSDDRQPLDADDLVYMVTGIDLNGDTHIFVSCDRGRAERRHREAVEHLTEVKANWLDR